MDDHRVITVEDWLVYDETMAVARRILRVGEAS